MAPTCPCAARSVTSAVASACSTRPTAGACAGRRAANDSVVDRNREGTHMGVSLSKGQSVSLVKGGGGTLTKVRMGLGWDAMKKKGLFGGMKTQSIDLDASCLLFDSAGALVDQVWFRQLRSTDGAVQH